MPLTPGLKFRKIIKSAIFLIVIISSLLLSSCQTDNIKVVITVKKNNGQDSSEYKTNYGNSPIDIKNVNNSNFDANNDNSIVDIGIANENEAGTSTTIVNETNKSTNGENKTNEVSRNVSDLNPKKDEHQALQIPILVYHHILPDNENIFGDNAFIVSLEDFEKQMKLLSDNNINTITLSELKAYIKGELKLTGKNVLITFDDGYKSNIEYAYPIMKRYSQRGVIFIVSGWIQNENEPFNPEVLQILSWSDIEAGRDVFEYASHSHNLHYKNNNNKSFLVSLPDELVYDDLLKSKKILDTDSIAFPYGEYSERTLELLEELGYEMGFTIEKGYVKPGDDMLRLKRNVIYRSISLEEFKRIIGIK